MTRIQELEAENKRLMDAIDQDEKDLQRLERQLDKCKEQRNACVKMNYSDDDVIYLDKELEDIK